MANINYAEKRKLIKGVERLIREGAPITKACFLLGTSYNAYKRAIRQVANPTPPKYKVYNSDAALINKVERLIAEGYTVEISCEKAQIYPAMYYKAKRRC